MGMIIWSEEDEVEEQRLILPTYYIGNEEEMREKILKNIVNIVPGYATKPATFNA